MTHAPRPCLELLNDIIYDIESHGVERAFDEDTNTALAEQVVPAILSATGIDMFHGIEESDVVNWLRSQPISINTRQAEAIASAVLDLDYD